MHDVRLICVPCVLSIMRSTATLTFTASVAPLNNVQITLNMPASLTMLPSGGNVVQLLQGQLSVSVTFRGTVAASTSPLIVSAVSSPDANYNGIAVSPSNNIPCAVVAPGLTT